MMSSHLRGIVTGFGLAVLLGLLSWPNGLTPSEYLAQITGKGAFAAVQTSALTAIGGYLLGLFSARLAVPIPYLAVGIIIVLPFGGLCAFFLTVVGILPSIPHSYNWIWSPLLLLVFVSLPTIVYAARRHASARR